MKNMNFMKRILECRAKKLTVPAEGVVSNEPVNTRPGTHENNQPSVAALCPEWNKHTVAIKKS